MDLEAVEAAVRSSMHQAGAAVLQQLLKFDPPRSEQRQVPCCCGHTAKYLELRSKLVLSAVGEVQCVRPYFLCERCHVGQFPVDVELDIENTEFSPGVRRMQALVGQQVPFDHGRAQMQILAGLEVTTKSVERTAEAIGDDIVQREKKEVQKALQLDLPVVMGEPIPILYVQMDGTGVPVVKKETAGRQGKTEGLPAHTREAKLGCVFTQTTWDQEGYAIRDSDSTTYTGAIENRGRVWQAHLSRSVETRLEPCEEEGGYWRWRRMDLESCRRTFSGRHPDCRSIPCSPASVGGGTPAVSPRGSQTENLDEGPPEAPAGQGENRKTRGRAAVHPHRQSPNGREDLHRGRLLREKCRAHALSQVSPPALVCWLGCDRSWMQDGNRLSSQTIGNVLDRPGSQRHPGTPLFSFQRSL